MRSNLFSPVGLARKLAPGLLRSGATGLLNHDDMPKTEGAAEPDRLTLGRVGSLEVRLASTPKEIRKAQKLRYKVFYKEMSATPDAMAYATKRDADAFDDICDHLLVLDHDNLKRDKLGRLKPVLVGTYRLLRQSVAEQYRGFYSESEYDVRPILEANPGLNFLELGRSCVLKPYRNKRTVELLWHGVWAYVLMHRIDAMFGCASIEGTDPDTIATQLSFLHHHARAPEEWRARAIPSRYVEMNRIAREDLKDKAALRELPPLIKGYLRLGAYIGEGAVIDRQFGTTDVFIMMPVSALNERYVSHYGADASRFA